MNSYISNLYYSPVKSISFSNSKNLIVQKNLGIKYDRIFSFTRNIDKKKSIDFEKNPKKRNLHFFLTLRNSPFLNKYDFEFKDDQLSLILENNLINSISTKNRDNFDIISQELMSREKLIQNPIYLIYNDKFPFFDTMPYNSISLINLNSVEDFVSKISLKIEHERFRGNIYIKGAPPWKEFEWIGKKININNCHFLVTGKIPRCSATNLKPGEVKDDINLPLTLRKVYGHINMGVYLIPLNDGIINIDNEVRLIL